MFLARNLMLQETVAAQHGDVFQQHVAQVDAAGEVQVAVNGGVAQVHVGGVQGDVAVHVAQGDTRKAGVPFTDVPSSKWYADDIDIAYNIGYFKGTSDTTASPNASLTREQAAVVAVHVAQGVVARALDGGADGASAISSSPSAPRATPTSPPPPCAPTPTWTTPPCPATA